MPARYRVMMSDRLWEIRDHLVWPDGLGLAEDGIRIEAPTAADWSMVEVRDEHAPAELDGKLIELILRAHAGKRPTVVARVPVGGCG